MSAWRALVGSGLVALTLACAGGGGYQGEIAGPGGSCAVQADCVACEGASCLPLGLEYCAGGTCWLSGPEDDAGAVVQADPLLVLVVPDTFDAAERMVVQSASIRVFHPVTTSGGTVDCAALLAEADTLDADPTLNLLRTLDPPMTLGSLDSQKSLGANDVAVGEDRIFYVSLQSGPDGGGTAVARGCTDHVPVALGAPCDGDAACDYPSRCEMLPGEAAGRCGPLRVAVDLVEVPR